MKRFHVHVNVGDLDASIRFYSQLFAAAPVVVKDDYAKWMLDDPRLNFAISRRERASGVDHLGLQADDAAELAEIGQRLAAADTIALTETNTTCCYAHSDKYWAEDPQGLRWETFHTFGSATTYYAPDGAPAGEGPQRIESASSCCAPQAAKTESAACCGPAASSNAHCGS